MKNKFSSRQFTHKFNDDEITEMTGNLVNQMADVNRLEIEKKENAKSFKKKIDGLQEQNNIIASHLRSGEMLIDVAIEIRYHTPSDGIKTIIRQDTHEAWEEPMTEYENTLDSHMDEEE